MQAGACAGIKRMEIGKGAGLLRESQVTLKG